jgi:hypothetical protein
VSADDPVELFLDELLLELRGSPRAVRRALAEVEEHLRDAAREGVSEGLDEPQAARRAVERFGQPELVARQLARGESTVGAVALGREAVATLLPVGAVFLLAIGLSGLLAEAFGWVFGRTFVAGDAPGVTYTAERCAQFLSFEPAARSCEDAAIAHHFGEVVGYRVAAGVLGVLVLAGWAVWRRRTRGRRSRGALAPSFGLTVGAALASAAAAALLFLGSAGPITGHYDGTGNPLSGGIVSACLGLAFGVALWRELRARRPAVS